jgi:hypothetical protein
MIADTPHYRNGISGSRSAHKNQFRTLPAGSLDSASLVSCGADAIGVRSQQRFDCVASLLYFVDNEN